MTAVDRGETVARAIVVALALLLVAYVVRSFTWRIGHDVPLAHYSAFMHAQYGTKPYEQVFEISFPGTILAHLAITKVFGYGDLGAMLANFVWLIATAGVTFALMSEFGRIVAVTAVALFGTVYFEYGPEMMLQRDWLLILPVAGALLLHVRGKLPPRVRRATVGFLVGLAVAMKPHSGLALAPIVATALYPLWFGAEARTRSVAQRALATVSCVVEYSIGFALPCAFVFAWLVASGGFAGWLEMTRQYLPLYLHMTGAHETIEGSARLIYVVKQFVRFGHMWRWFPAAGVGAFLTLRNFDASSAQARLIRLLLAEAGVFAVYPALAGQFWQYHYGPLTYFLCVLAAPCLMTLTSPTSLATSLLPKAVLLLTLFGHFKLFQSSPLLHRQVLKNGVVDEIATFLRSNLKPQDTVQPLDWTGGVVQAMLVARAPLGTRFMYDYHFYHHVSRPFIQLLRHRFMTDMQSRPPRFVVAYLDEDKPWPSGADTTREFPELRQFLTEHYRTTLARPKFRIYERLPPAN